MVGIEVKIFDFYRSSDHWGIHFQHIYTKPHRTRLDIQLYMDIKSPNNTSVHNNTFCFV